MTWPETWATVPPQCPVCDAPAVADRRLDSSHGPGWRCALDASHYWRVRLNPLRRALAAHFQVPRYPWYGASPGWRPTTALLVWHPAHPQRIWLPLNSQERATTAVAMATTMASADQSLKKGTDP